MIYVKYGNKIYNGNSYKAIKILNYNFIYGSRKFDLFKKVINETLNHLGFDVDIYFNLKNTGKNPLGSLIFHNFSKIRIYKRKNKNPFIIIYPNRLLRCKGTLSENFLKVLYHELIHYKELFIDKKIKTRHSKFSLPTNLRDNKIKTLSRILNVNRGDYNE